MEENETLDKLYQNRSHYANNHIHISECYWNFINKKGRVPKIVELAELTGFTTTTIQNHIDDIGNKQLTEKIQSLKLLTEMVILGLAKTAILGGHGQAACGKLFLQVVENFEEKKQISVVDRIGNMTEDEITKELEQYSNIIHGKFPDSNRDVKKNLGT